MLEGQPIQLLSIHVHGHFWDVGTEVKRSFNRVILLTPAGPHTRAFQSGWPALIVNDMLTIHNFLGAPARSHLRRLMPVQRRSRPPRPPRSTPNPQLSPR